MLILSKRNIFLFWLTSASKSMIKPWKREMINVKVWRSMLSFLSLLSIGSFNVWRLELIKSCSRRCMIFMKRAKSNMVFSYSQSCVISLLTSLPVLQQLCLCASKRIIPKNQKVLSSSKSLVLPFYVPHQKRTSQNLTILTLVGRLWRKPQMLICLLISRLF